jgi:carbamoyl-phosphate synthase large subunit
VTGAGSPGFPGVIQSLRLAKECNIRIIGADMNRNAAGRFLSDAFYEIPKASDPAFVPELLSICKRENVDVLLSMVSSELISLASRQNDFERAGTKVSVSQPDGLKKVMNKGILFRTLQDALIAVPKYAVAGTVTELKEAILAMGFPEQAVCFKPVVSDGSRGFHILDPNVDRLKILFHEKPNSAYVSYPELMETLKDASEIPELLVMEYLPHEEFSIDMLVDRGHVLVAVPRLRAVTVNGITTQGVITEEKDVIEYTVSLVEELGLHGNIGVQVRRDCARKPKLIEINPRLQGTIVHCTGAGVNLPFLAVKLALGMPIEQREMQIQWGTKMSRYWKEVFYDVHGSPYAL